VKPESLENEVKKNSDRKIKIVLALSDLKVDLCGFEHEEERCVSKCRRKR
jgi:hypothetical protein